MKENKHLDLEHTIKELIASKRVPIHDWYGNHVKIGVVSDTHIGSLYERNDFLRDLYKIFHKEGIKEVYHCGDMVDGENMYRGQEYEIYVNGADGQTNAAKDRYPNYKDITTFFITGNHDLSFWKRSGVDIGNIISEKRKDLVYLGQEEKDVIIGGKNKVKLRLCHPGKGASYALSYHFQKYIESLSGGRKPHVLLMGHYHKALYMPCYRNVFTIGAGCVQSQTSYMRRNNLSAHIGGWILDMRIGKNGITQFQANFIPYYER